MKRKSACYYKQALALYKGELLPDISTEIWVIEENLQLKMIFDTCVQRLADYFKRNGKDAELEHCTKRLSGCFLMKIGSWIRLMLF